MSPLSLADLSFFRWQDNEWLFGSSGSNPIGIDLCSDFLAESCQPVTLRWATTNTEVDADVDGPSLIETDSGMLLLLNLSIDGSLTASDLHIAVPDDETLLAWTVGDALSLNSNVNDDDGAWAMDGLMLFFTSTRSSPQRSLFYSTRSALDAPWEEPVEIQELSLPDSWEGTPEVHQINPTTMHVFFASDREGIFYTYEAICTYE